jgi:NTP pyrophosphatase (non-canonical NTP hydrolase)
MGNLTRTLEAKRPQIEHIADHYGLESRLDILQEECAELIQAVSKLRRSGLDGAEPGERSTKRIEARGKVSEEMADVLNTISQVMHLLHNEDTVEFWLGFKVGRTLRGMTEGIV